MHANSAALLARLVEMRSSSTPEPGSPDPTPHPVVSATRASEDTAPDPSGAWAEHNAFARAVHKVGRTGRNFGQNRVVMGARRLRFGDDQAP